MRHTRGQVVEVLTLSDFDRRMRHGTRSLRGWRLHDLDLRERTQPLRDCQVAGSLFLGCDFAPGEEEAIRARGGIVFPQIPDVPVDSYRDALYTARELFGEGGYAGSLDARVYAWSQVDGGRETTLARALHDHSVDEALTAFVEEQRFIEDRRIVGVMGGHALERGSAGFAGAARLGHAVGGWLTVATGGGPGAMEAANLGARLSSYDDDVLAEALTALARVPSFTPDVGAWAEAAFSVLAERTEATTTLGVPTWHYGHEPPNAFATHIAKYFRNATREAVLLEICDAGIVFLPGAGGTVQEIFQDACENYYADESSVAPMVLVGVDHWTRDLPAWPLLRSLAHGRVMEPHVHLVDTIEEAAVLLADVGSSQ